MKIILSLEFRKVLNRHFYGGDSFEAKQYY